MYNTQYSYNPPPTGGLNDVINRLRWLIQAPTAYLTFTVGMAFAFYLSLTGSIYGPRLFILLLAFPIHELAHAITADRLGDETPRYYGHITLNPFAQLNLLGSVLMMLFGFGWAYVPISPNNLRPNPRTGHMLVAMAGPIANIVLAILTAILWQFVKPFTLSLDADMARNVYLLFIQFSIINIFLFFFNLIPLAPLDGFFVLRGVLPFHLAAQLDRLQPYTNFIFLALFLLPFFTNGYVDVIGWLINGPVFSLARLLY